ncbi:MAG TPA: DUF58 domain-containing protein, partial [Anaerolineae bacterium]|nr:DUF58 domain-containing protein [Anaerolineae bacterium]
MNKALTLLLIVFSLLLTALVTRNADLIWLALLCFVYLGTGFLQSPSAREVRLSATRSVEKDTIDALATIEVSVVIINRGTAFVRLFLSDPLQSGMNIKNGQNKQSAILQAGETAVFKYTFQSERGIFAWKTIRAKISDPFGLIETELDLPAEAKIQIHPELKKFRPLPLRPQRTLHSAGSIPARLGGSGTDFWGVREYHPGDPLRRLDWRLTARHPHKFFTKEFEQEEIADIGLILDARQKTNLQIGEDSLFEHAVRATASLAEVFLRQGNRVSLLVYQRRIASVYPGYGKLQLNRVLHTLARITPESEDSLNSLLYLPIQMFSSHSLIVVVSPLMSGDWRLFRRLRAYGYQVLLISPDPLDYARDILPIDLDSRLATRLTRLERQTEINQITQLWIPVIDWHVAQPLAPLVRHALRHTRIQREH